MLEDYFSDSGHFGARLLVQYDIPAYVENGSVDTEKRASLSGECFADSNDRLFPIHSRAHTFMSAAYLSKQASREEAPEIYDAIEKRAAIFGISDDIKAIQEFVHSTLVVEDEQKTAAQLPAPPPSFAFNVEIGIPSVKVIAGKGKQAANRAVEYFLSIADKVPSRNVVPAAQEFCKVAEQHGVDIDPRLFKYAAVGSNDAESISIQKGLRLGLISDPGVRNAAKEKLASILTPDALDEFDSEHKLAGWYGERLEHPVLVFHSGQKEAAPADILDQVRISDPDRYKAACMAAVGKTDISEGDKPLVRQYL